MARQRATAPDEPSPVVAFGRLLRIALFPSAVADVVCGLAIGTAGMGLSSISAWFLVPASLGVYHGAMALNDWADRREDATSRPDRPIPSGAIGAGFALTLAVTLVIGGVLWAAGAGLRAGALMAAVAACAVLYDLVGRGPLRGPLLLGACRAGNLCMGLLAPWMVDKANVVPAGTAEDPWPPLALLALPLVYGAHVFFIGRLGRLEDEEDKEPLGERPSRALAGAAVTALFVPAAATVAVLGAHQPSPLLLAGLVASAALAGRNAWLLGARLRATRAEGWTRPGVEAATGLCLRRLSMFTASMALSVAFAGALGAGAMVVAVGGAYVTRSLRGVFPVT